MIKKVSIAILLLSVFLSSGCAHSDKQPVSSAPYVETYTVAAAPTSFPTYTEASEFPETDFEQSLSVGSIPLYNDSPYIIVNNNIPYFANEEITTESFESYSELDDLGRCGAAMACIGIDIMPIEERGKIGQIKPTGWQTVKYDFIDGKYLYNRCHLIGFQLAGENANERNLITGTRYMNVEGMLPFENEVADYVRNTGNHVLYRVSPIFSGNDLLAQGVLMEALSVEDRGEGIRFNVFCYNVQPGVEINYATGESQDVFVTTTEFADKSECKYVLNTNSRKIHRSDCKSVQSIRPKNKKETDTDYDDLIAQDYSPCGSCRPE